MTPDEFRALADGWREAYRYHGAASSASGGRTARATLVDAGLILDRPSGHMGHPSDQCGGRGR